MQPSGGVLHILGCSISPRNGLDVNSFRTDWHPKAQWLAVLFVFNIGYRRQQWTGSQKTFVHFFISIVGKKS